MNIEEEEDIGVRKEEEDYSLRSRDHKQFHEPTTLLFTEEEVKLIDWKKVWTDW